MTKKTDPGRIPGPAVIAGCIEVIIPWGLVNARTGHSVLHGRNSGSFVPSVGSANTLQTAVVSAWNSNLALYAPTTTVIGILSVRDMSVATNPAFIGTVPGTSGTSASPALPPQIANVLSGRTAMRGKGFNARMYVPCWASNADAGNGQTIAAVTTAMNAFGTALFSAFTSSGLQPCVAHPARQAYTGIAGAQHPQRSATTVDLVNWTQRDTIWDTIRARVKP